MRSWADRDDSIAHAAVLSLPRYLESEALAEAMVKVAEALVAEASEAAMVEASEASVVEAAATPVAPFSVTTPVSRLAIVRAAVTDMAQYGQGKRPVGASTM